MHGMSSPACSRRFVPFAWSVAAAPARAQDSPGDDPQPPSTPRPVAVEYSDGYYTRAKIHKYASFATLPLFATEVALGQTIYNDPNAQQQRLAKGAHIAVGTAITGLFAVNTVTGVWNMWESRHDPEPPQAEVDPRHPDARRRRRIRGDVRQRPRRPDGANLDSQKQTHRTIALTSIGLATGSYLLMLFGNK